MPMEELVERTPVFAGELLKVFRDVVRVPGEKLARREVVEHPGSVGLIPVDALGRAILVRQWRHAVGQYLWEIPAGTAAPGETPRQTAERELQEETGYAAERWTELGSAFLVPGWATEAMVFFKVERLVLGAAKPEEDERLSRAAFSLHDLRSLRAGGELRDAKTLLGLAWAGFDLWGATPDRAGPTIAKEAGSRELG